MIPLQGPSQIITGDETLVVIEEGKVVYVDGKPVKPNPIQFSLTCNVQPLDGRELMLVPEGDRYKEQYWVFTNEMDRPVRDNQRVLRQGIQFQIQETEQWGSYQAFRMTRIDVGPNESVDQNTP